VRLVLARSIVRSALTRVREGSLTVVDGGRATTYGSAACRRAAVVVHDERAYAAVARRGSVGLGEAYAAGWFDADDLATVIEIAARDLDRVRRRVDRVADLVAPVRARLPVRSRGAETDRSYVAAHYDLSNELFARMLDPTMTYSCAVFDGTSSLEEAQRAKLDRLAALLRLEPDDHVLEIGTGWGGLAVHFAREHGCRVTTTTISAEQHAFAVRRVDEAGLADRVTVLDRDYRHLEGRFDKVVSVEMIEAVDWRDHRGFFDVLARRARPGGRVALQAIVIADGSFEAAKRRTDFIKAFVFPGGCLPSVGSITAEAARAGLRRTDLHSIGASYPPTLAAWADNVAAARDELSSLGFDRPFQRIWEMYLAYCIGAFRSGHVDAVQVAFDA
jgi:cyclopropane-fatty-acyl-phospholipid synthase